MTSIRKALGCHFLSHLRPQHGTDTRRSPSLARYIGQIPSYFPKRMPIAVHGYGDISGFLFLGIRNKVGTVTAESKGSLRVGLSRPSHMPKRMTGVLSDNFPRPLSQDTQQIKYHTASGRASVERFGNGYQSDAMLREQVQQIGKVTSRAGESVESADDDAFNAALSNRLKKSVHCWPSKGLGGGPRVSNDLRHCPTHYVAILGDSSPLSSNANALLRLRFSAYAGITNSNAGNGSIRSTGFHLFSICSQPFGTRQNGTVQWFPESTEKTDRIRLSKPLLFTG
jgi:hypothetical protein